MSDKIQDAIDNINSMRALSAETLQTLFDCLEIAQAVKDEDYQKAAALLKERGL